MFVIASQRVARMRARWQAPRSNPSCCVCGRMDCFVASAQNCFAILSRAPRADGLQRFTASQGDGERASLRGHGGL